MTGRIEKTVFISYRRTNVPWALAIYQNLTMHGYDVFFDYQSIDSGNFENVILENIKSRAHFLVILTPSALERCKESGDWLRREIETAIDEKRNIVPLMLESFDFGSSMVKDALNGKLASLNQYNGLRVHSEYFFEAMNKLRERYLNVAVSNIALSSLNLEAKEITETQKIAASEAPQVENKQLIVQELFERGYKLAVEAKDFDGAFRSFSEAFLISNSLPKKYRRISDKEIVNILQLKNQEYFIYFSRGSMLREKGDLKGAIANYTEAIRFIPLGHFVGTGKRILYDQLNVFEYRGFAYQLQGDFLSAMQDYHEAINLEPKNVSVRKLLINILQKLERKAEAEEQEEQMRLLVEMKNEYSRACFEAFCGNTDEALELLKIGLDKKQSTKEWARQDPDLENIRNDPRFKELVGE